MDGDDYVIDLRRGKIFFPAGTTITESQSLKLTYSYSAHVKQDITGGTTPTADFYVEGDMEDRLNDGENGELRIPKVTLSVDGDIDWLGTDPIQIPLAGDCVIADGEDDPYTFTLYSEAA